jgi:predicted Zn-dependent peptidase
MNFMKQKILTILFLFIGTISMNAQGSKIEFEEYDLDNGLHVILHEDHSTPIVAVTVLYHVGSKNENPNRTGFAHFFEHLLFEGSENIGRGEFDKYIQKAGGMMNANTTQDRTFYFEVLPSNQLELGLWLESERMLHAKVDEKGVETQRQVVKEERRQRVDNQPYGSLMEETFKRAYSEHPYKWSVIGSMDHLDAAEEKDYIQFYEDFYIPNNATLSIAGDFKPAELKEWIKKYFGSIPKGKEPFRPNTVEPPLKGEVRDIVYDNVQLPLVVQSYRIPAQGTKDYYAIQMLSTLMSQGGSSRLNKSLVDEQELAIASGSFPFSMEDPGISLGYAIANMGVDVAKLEAAMDKEFAKVRNELITKEEFQKLRNQVENDFVSQNARVQGIAESLANYHTYYGDANLINDELARYMDVTREDIQRVAKKYFVKDNRVVLQYLPKSAQP